MKTYLTGRDIFENWSDEMSSLKTASGINLGINVEETLTTNSIGATVEQKNFMFNRYEILGFNLFDLLPQCLARIGGIPPNESLAVLPVLANAAVGNLPSDRETLASLRLDAKKPLPKGFNMDTDRADNALVLAAYYAILSLEEVLRKRTHRSAWYAASVVRLMAAREGAADSDAEYRWFFDRMLGYYV